MLALSNVLVRILGLVYKVWLAKEISPVALGIYQLAMSVYSVFITPVASGLPSATSRLSAKYLSQHKEDLVLSSAMRLALFPLTASLIILLLGRNMIAGIFLHDKTMGTVILALIPAVTVGALASLPSAYLHAKGRSAVPAVLEIIEQLFKVLTAFLLLKAFTQLTVPEEAAVPVVAVSLGGVLSFIMTVLFVKKISFKKGGFERELLENALPHTLARLGTSVLHLCTTTVLPLCLIHFGLSKEAALSEYGILTSMAYPVVFAPMTVISAISVITLPEIAKSLESYKAVLQKFRLSFIISLAITLLFSLFILLFAPYLAEKLFRQALAGRFMVMLIPSIIFLGLSNVSRTLLNGLGKQKTLMVTSIVDGMFGLILTFFLARSFGIYGFILGNCIQDLLAFLLNFTLCLRELRTLQLLKVVVK